MNPRIHPTALVAASARLMEGVEVGPYAIIEDEVEIGAGSRIAAHAVIKRYSRLGRDNRVFEHAVIGGEPQDYKFKGDASRVVIGDGNQIREYVSIHRSNHAGGETRVGDGCFLMACSHVAHDCTLGNQAILANGALLGGHVEVGERAFLSGAVTVHQFCRIGRLAMVAASCRVNQDCLPFCITDGNPGRARGLNLVGLKRAAWPAAEIAALKAALRLLRGGAGLEAALASLAASESPAQRELADFIRAAKRGFAHPPRA